MNELARTADVLHAELRTVIAEARARTAVAVNAELTRLYWRIGQRVHVEILGGARAAYGQQIVASLGERLAAEFGRGFEAKNLRRMVQFAESFPDFEIVATLSRQLTWSVFVEVIPLKDHVAREFYARMAATHGWSVRELRRQIDTKSFERTAIASTQGTGIERALTEFGETGTLPVALAFKDPYVLDFLGLRDTYSEKSLEDAILRELESFMLELGTGFAFVERQKRLVIDGEDFYLDLLFFHRRLRRLVVVELKLGRFKAAYKGQMELYLRWLDKHERQPGEEKPIGLILCAEASSEQVELLEMHQDGIVVAEYWTELPPREEWQRRLHTALVEARERLAARGVLLEAEVTQDRAESRGTEE